MFNNTIKTACLAVASLAALTMMSSDANAQCARGGGGFGGSGFSLSIGTGYGGFGSPFYGGFNRGVSFNTFNSFRPVYGRPSVGFGYSHYGVSPGFYNPGLYRPYGGRHFHSHRIPGYRW